MRLRENNVLFQHVKSFVAVTLAIVSSMAWAMSPGVESATTQVNLKLLYELEDNMPVTSLAWSPDGRFIAASSSQDKRIHIWNLASRRIVHEFTSTVAPRPFHELAWSHDGKWLVGCDGYMGGVLVFDATTWSAPQVLNNAPDVCIHVAFSDDSRQLAVLGSSVTSYSTSNWQVVKRIDIDAANTWTRGKWIRLIDFVPHSHTVVLGGAELVTLGSGGQGREEYVGCLWFLGPGDSLPGGRRQAYFHTETSQTGIVVSLAIRPDGSELATGADTGSGSPTHMVSDSVHILRASDGSIVATPLDGKGFSNQAGLAYTSDGQYLIVAHGGVRVEHVVHVLDTKTYAIAGSVPTHGTIYDVAVEPSSKAFAVSAGGTISVWTLTANQ